MIAAVSSSVLSAADADDDDVDDVAWLAASYFRRQDVVPRHSYVTAPTEDHHRPAPATLSNRTRRAGPKRVLRPPATRPGPVSAQVAAKGDHTGFRYSSALVGFR